MIKVNYKQLSYERNTFIVMTSNYKFCNQDLLWRLDKNSEINLALIYNKLNREYHEGFLNTLTHFAITYSPSYTKKMFYAFLNFLNNTEEGSIKDVIIKKYHNYSFSQMPEHLSSLRVFFKKWNQLGYNGVTNEHLNILYRGKIKKRKIGEMVNTNDPQKGPLSEKEIIEFNDMAVQLFDQGELEFDELVMVYLISCTGRRPIQISQLKIEDVIDSNINSASESYYINMPRAKHSGSFRSQFSKLRISKTLHEMMSELAEEVIGHFQNKTTIRLTREQSKTLPLFLDKVLLEREKESERESLLNHLKIDRYHIKSRHIDARIKKVGRQCKSLVSKNGKINARRFRYSLGTRAAECGYGEYVIAELLDHRSTNNVGCYVKNIPEYAEKINDLVGEEISKYAKLFNMKNELRSEVECLAHCDLYSSLKIPFPILCYGCIHFTPWIDAPHHLVKVLINEQMQNLNNSGGNKSVDREIDILKSTMQYLDKIIYKQEQIEGKHNVKYC